jgi:hypothetical protein
VSGRPERGVATPIVGVPAAVRGDWAALTPSPGDVPAVDPARIDRLPPPVRRWLTHALAAGVPRWERAELEMRGRIRIGAWIPFRAREVLAPPAGFVWAGSAGRFPLRLTGFDRYRAGAGELRWKLFGVLPVMTGAGPDISRSGAGRLAGEALLLPTAALAPWVRWRREDDTRAVADVEVDGAVHPVTVEVDPAGRPRSCSMPRWGNPDRRPAREHTFGVVYDGEVSFHGVTLPRRFTAGWDWDGRRWDRGPFFQATISHARFF